ncbi:MAG: hypothetical protein J6J04_01520, partial [Oscillospiraceae bacterium]|nr:hypothetical protein [Oscillospiraceae bacterium]
MLICSLVRNEKARSSLTAIIVGIGIGFFLQSNLMAGPYGSLNGAAIDWSSMDRWGVLTSGVWVLCIAVPAALVLLLKNRRILNLIAGVVLALQVLTCVVLIAIGGTQDMIKTDDFSITNEEAFTLSDKQNVVVFLTDNFSSTLLEEIITEDTAYNEQFDGFTYFPDTSGGGCTTKGGLPFILTGMWNDNSLSYKDYLKQGYENNKLYSTLEELGYDSRLFVEKQYVDSSAAAIFENMEYEKTIVNEPMVMQLMYKLTAFTCFPHYLKEFFWMYTGEFAEATISEEDSTHLTPDTAFYNSLMSIGLSTNSDYTGAYRFYYLNGPHAPYTMDENAQYSDNATEMQQAKGSLKIVSDYIQQLKALGLYDDTMIVVLADHGDWESEELFNPMLMVKPFASETDGITVSEAPISYVDLMPTFMEALTGEDCGTTIFEIPKDQPRERRFLYYEWAGDWSSSYMPQMYEFSITGNVRDITSRTPTGMVYSPGGKVTDAREYHLGQLIPYMEDEPGYPTYVRYGLLFAESSMTWTRGSYTHWSFPMADYTSGDLVFTLDLLLVRYDKQQVDLYVNDTYVESRTVTTSGKLEFTIPAELISDSTLEIRLEYPDVASQQQDVRGLGIRTVVLNTPGGEVIPYESTQDDGFSLTHIIGIPLTALLNACNRVLNNYVLAIFVFTFLTKVILLPVSLWTNKN